MGWVCGEAMSGSVVREGCRKAKTYGGRGMLAVEGLEAITGLLPQATPHFYNRCAG
jgi:hypothetical protein